VIAVGARKTLLPARNEIVDLASRSKIFDRRSLVAHDAMICFSDETGSVIQTPEHAGDSKAW